MIDTTIEHRLSEFGQDHPTTRSVLATRERWSSSRPVNLRIYQAKPFTYKDLASILDRVETPQTNETESVNLLRSAFDKNELLVDVRDRATIATKLRLGDLLIRQGWYDEARLVAKDAHRCAKETFGRSAKLAVEAKNQLTRASEGLRGFELADSDLSAPNDTTKVAGNSPGAAELEVKDLLKDAKDFLFSDPDRACRILKAALARSDDFSDPDNPDILEALGFLSVVLINSSRWSEAIPHLERAVRFANRTRGNSDDLTLENTRILATAYLNTGQPNLAVEAGEELLKVRRDQLGPSHPLTLMAMANLAVFLSEADRRDEAVRIEEEVLARRIETLGPTHPETIASRSNLGETYTSLLNPAAVDTCRQALTDAEAMLGPTHDSTVVCRSNYANALRMVGDMEQAIEVIQQVLQHRMETLGREHPLTHAVGETVKSWVIEHHTGHPRNP